MYTQRDEDVILFHHEGGIDIGDVDSKVSLHRFIFFSASIMLTNLYNQAFCALIKEVA